MKIDPQHLKLARIVVLVTTGIVVGGALMTGWGFAMLVIGMRIFTSSMGRPPEEIPPDFYRGELIVSAVVLPAVALILFYFRSLSNCLSRGSLVAGWSASAVYHASLTLFLILRMPTASIGREGQMVPIALLTGVALLLSILLAIQARQNHSGNSRPLCDGERKITV